MKKPSKKAIIIISIIVLVIVGFVLLTTVGKPLLSKSITAEKVDDFRNVCYNNKIVNAADYTTANKAIVAGFYEKPHSNDNPWSNVVSNGDEYYAKFGEQTKVSVVACFEYQASGNKQVATCSDLKLMSARYTTTFYEAKTGEKIAEGEEIVNDDPTCPSVVVYDKFSKETAKAPDTTAMQEAIAKFVGK